jgi:uncharacterized protein (TIRG00374 family)
LVQHDARSILARSRRWIAVAAAVSALLYVAYGAVSGWRETGAALQRFQWWWTVPVLLTTLGNYGLRYVKWVLLLRQVGVRLAHRKNIPIYAIGLMMTLSPAKAGEVAKPWLVREVTGTPLVRTLPVLVAERATDAIAILVLAAIGATTHATEQVGLLAIALGVIVVGLALSQSALATSTALMLVRRIPGLNRLAEPIEDMLEALRECLSPGSFAVAVGLSIAAWWLECVGTWLVLLGFGVDVSLGTATFIYAFATALGAISPGGVGVTDATLIQASQRLIVGVSLGTATAAALLLRIATLWFGVILGAIALLGVNRWLEDTPCTLPPPSS